MLMHGFKANLLLSLTLLGAAFWGPAFAADNVCETDSGRISGHPGAYISRAFVSSLDSSKKVSSAVGSLSGIPAIWVDGAGNFIATLSSFNDEAQLSDFPNPAAPLCVSFTDNAIVNVSDRNVFGTIDEITPPYLRFPIGDGNAPREALIANFIFNRLFRGCFADSDGHKWCFENSTVRVEGQPTQHVELTFDKLQKGYPPGGGTVLLLNNRQDMLVLVPVNHGWEVFKSLLPNDKAYAEPDWTDPWQVLSSSSVNVAPKSDPDFFSAQP